MAQVRVVREVAGSAAKVWDYVSDLTRAKGWPAVEACQIDGEGVGCVRTMRLIGGEIVRERLESRDDTTRRYRSVVTELGAIPIEDIDYSVTILEGGPDRCSVEWIANFEPVGISEERACEMVEGLCISSILTIADTMARSGD
jgi:hypothetical protein